MLSFIVWASVQTISGISGGHYHPEIKELHSRAMSHVWSKWCITENKHNPTVYHCIGAKGRRWVMLLNHTMPWDQPWDDLPSRIFWLVDAFISVSSAQEASVQSACYGNEQLAHTLKRIMPGHDCILQLSVKKSTLLFHYYYGHGGDFKTATVLYTSEW